MSHSFPTVVDADGNNVKIIFTNFSGELTVKDIIEFKKYVECRIPDSCMGSFKAESCPSPTDVNNLKKLSVIDQKINENDEDSVASSAESQNLLEDSDDSDDNDGDYSTVPDLEKACGGLNIAVADDDDIEFDGALSQQVLPFGWK